MKALSLTQPWASLVAMGAKRIETRGWQVAYRGQLAIHASRHFPRECRELCQEWPFDIYVPDWKALPLGAVLAVVELCEIKTTEQTKADDFGRMPDSEATVEYCLGDYSPGRFAWYLRNYYKFPTPIPCRGLQGLWNWEHPEAFSTEFIV